MVPPETAAPAAPAETKTKKRPPRQKAGQPMRIYGYRAFPPVTGHAAIEDQVRRGHAYKNTLVRLERCRRHEVDEVLLAYPDLPRLEAAWQAAAAEVEELKTAVKRVHSSERSRAGGKDLKARLRAARAAKRDAYALYKARKTEAFGDPAITQALEAVDAAHRKRTAAARRASELSWGTYQLVEEALRQIRKGPPPRYRRWRSERLIASDPDWLPPFSAEGAVAVHIQNRVLTWADVCRGDDQWLRLVPAGRDGRAVLWLRLGTEARQPVWATVPLALHREPPEDAAVKWVYLHRCVRGKGVYWQVQFVLGRESWAREDRAAEGTCGVDLNWRRLKGGLRVATAVGGDGRVETLFLPEALLDRKWKAESLQSIRTREFSAARDNLADWMGAAADLPAWLAETAAHLRLWKSDHKLAALVWYWHEHRFGGDETIFAAMEAWRRQDKHLHQWAENQATNIARRRDEIYRRFAHALARRYHTIRVEDTNWKEVKQVPQPEEPASDAARVYGQLAAAGRFRQVLRECAAALEEVPAANTTKRCHACGRLCRFDAARFLTHCCEGCGARWDQDENAGHWILRGGAVPEELPPEGGEG